jgi:hypothetical protein
LFPDIHGAEIPDRDGENQQCMIVPKTKPKQVMMDDHFRREVYIGAIDQISQELHNRFDELMWSYYFVANLQSFKLICCPFMHRMTD